MNFLITWAELTCGMWLFIYLFIGWAISWDEPKHLRLLYTLGWVFMPALMHHFDLAKEKSEPFRVEGNCVCRKRAHFDAGAKYCSICGGKIKDRTWRKR